MLFSTEEIQVSIGDLSVNCYILDSKNVNISLKSILKQTNFEIKYFNIGEIVSINLGNAQIDQVIIKDSILNSTGEYIYSEKETYEVSYTISNNKYHFKIQKHKASMFSSYYLKNKTNYRGYSIEVHKNKSMYTFAFVILTDSFWKLFRRALSAIGVLLQTNKKCCDEANKMLVLLPCS